METKNIGYKYHEVDRFAPVTVIAKAMREEIKEAKKSGLLPKHWKYSVTCHHRTSISIRVESFGEGWMPENVENCKEFCYRSISSYGYHSPYCPGSVKPTEEAEAARITLERIHQAFNHDNSDIMTDYFDVRYYGQVIFLGGC